MRTRLVVIFFALAVSLAAQAQEQKIAVSLSHSGDDVVGKQFAFAIREAIRGSHAFRLVPPDESGIQVRLITLNPEDAPASANWTVASIVITMANFLPYEAKKPQTWYPIYLTSHVSTVGRSRTEDQAKNILASIDEQVERYRRDAAR